MFNLIFKIIVSNKQLVGLWLFTNGVFICEMRFWLFMIFDYGQFRCKCSSTSIANGFTSPGIASPVDCLNHFLNSGVFSESGRCFCFLCFSLDTDSPRLILTFSGVAVDRDVEGTGPSSCLVVSLTILLRIFQQELIERRTKFKETITRLLNCLLRPAHEHRLTNKTK